MPKQYPTPNKRRLNTLERTSPTSLMIWLGILVAIPMFVLGAVGVVEFTNWLDSGLLFPSTFTSTLAIAAIVVLFMILFLSLPAAFTIAYKSAVRKRLRALQFANIDSMAGIAFEQYLRALLICQGYRVRLTQASGDFGVDLVATRNDDTIAIQAKRHKARVSRQAVSDAVAGKQYYGCNQAMVVTNSYFSPGAVTLARSTGCALVDRDGLADWVSRFQSTDSRIGGPC